MNEGDFLQSTGPRGQISFITQCQGHTHLQAFCQTDSQDLGRIIPIWGHQEEMKRGIPKWGSPRSVHLLWGALSLLPTGSLSHKLPKPQGLILETMRALKFGCLKKGVYAQGVPMCLPRKRTPKRKLRLLLGGLPSNLCSAHWQWNDIIASGSMAIP